MQRWATKQVCTFTIEELEIHFSLIHILEKQLDITYVELSQMMS